MIGIVWAYHLFGDEDCDEEEEPLQKPKLDHEPVRAMAETPCKVYLDARQKVDALQRTRNVPSKYLSGLLSKNPENCLALANDMDVHPLVPSPPSPLTMEEVESLEALLASVPQPTDILGYGVVPLKMDQATQTKPPLPNQTDPPSPIAHEEICPFHPTSELQRGTSKKCRKYVSKISWTKKLPVDAACVIVERHCVRDLSPRTLTR